MTLRPAQDPLIGMPINGQLVFADRNEWDRVGREITLRQTQERQAWEDQRRAAGQVWLALYFWRSTACVDEYFSYEAARDFLCGEYQLENITTGAIRTPSGEFRDPIHHDALLDPVEVGSWRRELRDSWPAWVKEG